MSSVMIVCEGKCTGVGILAAYDRQRDEFIASLVSRASALTDDLLPIPPLGFPPDASVLVSTQHHRHGVSDRWQCARCGAERTF